MLVREIQESEEPLMNTTSREFGTYSITAVGAEHVRRFGPRYDWPSRLVALLVLGHERWRQRRRLAELDDRLLQDIGKTRREAVDEANKPFWRP
jgi:uncharacterized protein YjiS (DUF1127 family)